MIVKKPYAFLIKNFRLIHGLLFAVLIYLAIKTVRIYSFFNSFSSYGYQSESISASNYVDFIIFGACLIAIVISLLIYYLLSLKQKSNNMYMWIFIFYICLFIFFIYSHSLITKMESMSLKSDSLGIINELCLMAMIPQFVFCFIIFGRTLGFNLKQFEFKKDLEEIQLDESDSEEVELTLGAETYKIKRFFRKFIRLSKYFVLENKMFVIGGCSIFILVVLLSIYTKYNVYSVSYNEKQLISASSLGYTVNESYLTDTDVNNNIIKEGKYFVLVKVNITNRVTKAYSLTRETFTLTIGDKIIIPTFNLKKEFKDLGDTFEPTEIRLNESKDFVVVFEIDEKEVAKDYMLKVKNFGDNDFGKIETKYKTIIIKPVDLTKIVDKGSFELGSTISFNDTILNNYRMTISNFEIASKFKEKYIKKVGDEEIDSFYSIIPINGKGRTSVLKVTAKFENQDNTATMSKYINKPVDFFGYFGLINYRYLGNYKTSKLNKITTAYETDNYSYLEIPDEVANANKVKIIILIRGVKYTFNLK